MSNLHPGVPDLLKRFAPTPYQVDTIIGQIRLILQTNDPEIVDQIVKVSTELKKGGDASLRLKVIRDDKAPNNEAETVVLSAGPVLTLLAGTGTVLALDTERHEILGFIAAQVSAERFALEILPSILDVYRKTTIVRDPESDSRMRHAK